MIPLALSMAVCGVFESSIDLEFMAYSAGYTGRSILIFAAVFLIFYHIGILMITICGNILPAILGYASSLFYGNILIGNVFTTLAKNYFHTYYRLPLLEKLDVILAPVSLSGNLSGSGLYSKREVFEFTPSSLSIAAALAWIILLLFLFTAAQKKRKTERIGKLFVISAAERVAEILLSFIAGVWTGSFFIELSGFAGKKPVAAFALSLLLGVLAACAVHFLIEWGAGGLAGGRNFRRKIQLVMECAAVMIVGTAFFADASSFDSFLPEEGEIEKIGISIDGLDMDYDVYEQILKGESRHETDEQLETYLFAKEGKDAAAKWLGSLVERNRGKVMEAESGTGYTHAVVCYHLKSGKEVYRIYPVSEERLQAYASVYETEEYKQAAYQVPDSRYVMDESGAEVENLTNFKI